MPQRLRPSELWEAQENHVAVAVSQFQEAAQTYLHLPLDQPELRRRYMIAVFQPRARALNAVHAWAQIWKDHVRG